MKDSHKSMPLGYPSGDLSGPGTRTDSIPAPEIDITKDRLGEILGARRHQLGLKVEEIAEDIKIRADYLRALEQEAFDRMPTPEYGRLFLKSYSERLGLSVGEIYAIYDLHHRPATDTSPRPRVPLERGMPIGPTPRMPAPSRPLPKRLWLYLVIAVVAVAVIVAGVMKIMTPPGTEKELPSRSQVITPPAPEPKSEPVAEPAPAQGEPIEAEMHLVLAFDRETWASLIADDQVIGTRNFRAGEVLEAKALNRFRLSLGHTTGVRATVNGRELRPFESWAGQLTGLPITPDSIAAWLVPQSSSQAQPVM